jgi:acetyl-CoA carboxylase beta subunit
MVEDLKPVRVVGPASERCPACGQEMYPHEVEREQPVCDACDRRLERHLAAWLDFAAIRDAP